MNKTKMLLVIAPFGALLLFASHALFATHAGSIHIEMSSSGPLTPGNYRQLTVSDGQGTQRQYRIGKDATGGLIESYTENSKPKPISPAVRAWLMGVNTLVASPAVPEAPAVPEPPVPPAPPTSPAPPLALTGSLTTVG
jgi:hypothetical protein